MSHLYEKFILEYFRFHHPELRANPDQVQWDLDDDNDMWLPLDYSILDELDYTYPAPVVFIYFR